MSRLVWIYIAGVLLTAVAVSVLALAHTHLTLQHQLWPFGVLLALATISQLLPIEGTNRFLLFYATPVFLFAGALMLDPALFILLVTVPHLVEWVKEHWVGSPYLHQWYLQPFNCAKHIIAGIAAHWICTSLVAGPMDWTAFPSVLACTAAGLAYFALHQLLLAQALAGARSIPWRATGVFDRDSMLVELIMVCLGMLVAALWSTTPWLVLFAITPLLLIHRSLNIPKLKKAARVDSKTELLNARYFNERLTFEVDRAVRFGRPGALIMADLDFLRTINNTYGHLAGDAVLAGVGRLIQAGIRDCDIAGRFGGEEFAIFLSDTDYTGAWECAERLRKTIEQASFPVATSATPITATMSFGVACFPQDGIRTTDLTHAADVAMYAAKAVGRNRTVCASDISRDARLSHTPFALPSLSANVLATPIAPSRETARHDLP